jgi:hypothetical protein
MLDDMLYDFYVNENPVAGQAWLDYHIDHGIELDKSAQCRSITRDIRRWVNSGRLEVLKCPLLVVTFRDLEPLQNAPTDSRYYWHGCRSFNSCSCSYHISSAWLPAGSSKSFPTKDAAKAWLSRTAILWAYSQARPDLKIKLEA